MHGDCLKPIGITDDMELTATLLHGWESDINALSPYVGYVIAVVFKTGTAIFSDGREHGYVKVLTAVDTLHNEIWLSQLNPPKTYHFPIRWIKDILFVENTPKVNRELVWEKEVNDIYSTTSR